MGFTNEPNQSNRYRIAAYFREVYPFIKRIRGATYLFDYLKKSAYNSISTEQEDHIKVELFNEELKFQDRDDLDLIFNERREYKLFLNEIDNRSVIYDVGAFRGFYTVIGSLGEYSYGFEMSPQSFEILKDNSALNGDNTEVFNKAVWNENSEVKTKNKYDQGNSVGEGKATVEAVTLDKFSEKHKLPDIIKIDVEGAEFQVLEGAEKVLQNHKPTLFIEIHRGEKLRSFGHSEDQIYAFLEDLDYEESFRLERGTNVISKFS